MSNTTLFITQIGSTLVFIISLFVLYRLLVEQKEATIQFLQAQLTEAKQPISDALFKSQKDRLDAALVELNRHTKDKEILQGTNKSARLCGCLNACSRCAAPDAWSI